MLLLEGPYLHYQAHFCFIIIRHELCYPPTYNPLMKLFNVLFRKFLHLSLYLLSYEYVCANCLMFPMKAPPQPLHYLVAPWPFLAWGMDVIGPVISKASNGHEYILVAIDYFTKWVEAAPYKGVTQAMVARFLKHYIICCYSIPRELIIDNGVNLNEKMIQQLYQQFKIEHRNLVPYRLQMNGVIPQFLFL